MCDRLTIIQSDCIQGLALLEPGSIQCAVTSPPYWGLRSYLPANHPLKAFEIGTEKTPQEYVAKMLAVFGGKNNPVGVWRALKPDGTLWLNLGDCYAGSGRGGNPADSPHKKQSTNAESVTDRPTRAHEYIFLLSKSPKYYYDAAAIREPASPALVKQVEEGYNGKAIKDYLSSSVQDASATKSRIIDNARKRIDKQRGHGRRHAGFNEKWDALSPAELALLGANKRSVWTVAPANFKEAHFATFPPKLIKPCILAGSRPGDIVLDPFGGSGTTARVSLELGRKAVTIELNPEYIPFIERRTSNFTPGLALA